jgi:hypothetical protein
MDDKKKDVFLLRFLKHFFQHLLRFFKHFSITNNHYTITVDLGIIFFSFKSKIWIFFEPISFKEKLREIVPKSTFRVIICR